MFFIKIFRFKGTVYFCPTVSNERNVLQCCKISISKYTEESLFVDIFFFFYIYLRYIKVDVI